MTTYTIGQTFTEKPNIKSGDVIHDGHHSRKDELVLSISEESRSFLYSQRYKIHVTHDKSYELVYDFRNNYWIIRYNLFS